MVYPENKRNGTKTSGATSRANRADLNTVPKKIPMTLPNIASTTAPPTDKLTEGEETTCLRVEARNVINDRDENGREDCEKRKLDSNLREVVGSKAVKSGAVFFRKGLSFRGNCLAYKPKHSS